MVYQKSLDGSISLWKYCINMESVEEVIKVREPITGIHAINTNDSSTRAWSFHDFIITPINPQNVIEAVFFHSTPLSDRFDITIFWWSVDWNNWYLPISHEDVFVHQSWLRSSNKSLYFYRDGQKTYLKRVDMFSLHLQFIYRYELHSSQSRQIYLHIYVSFNTWHTMAPLRRKLVFILIGPAKFTTHFKNGLLIIVTWSRDKCPIIGWAITGSNFVTQKWIRKKQEDK